MDHGRLEKVDEGRLGGSIGFRVKSAKVIKWASSQTMRLRRRGFISPLLVLLALLLGQRLPPHRPAAFVSPETNEEM